MLSDSKIKERLDDFNFQTENENRPFSPELQIKIASVDLRLSNTFWRPKNRLTPLKFKPQAFGSDTVDLFQECIVKEDESITIKPNSFILCRTYEKFSVPIDLVARLHSRSSFARLGIQVSSTSDFINPGWSGYMPLVVFNSSPFSVELRPFDRLAQVCFTPLLGEPSVGYRAQESVGKYTDDDGGPSSLWLDICREGLSQTHFAGRSDEIDKILNFAKELNEPTRALFLSYLPKTSGEDNVRELFAKFIQIFKEGELKLKILALAAGPVISFTLGWLFLDMLEVEDKSFILGTLAVVIDVLTFGWAHSYLNRLDVVDRLEGLKKEFG